MGVGFSVIIRLLSARCGELWCMMLPPFPDEEMQKNPSEECECAEEDPQQSDVWPPESLQKTIGGGYLVTLTPA